MTCCPLGSSRVAFGVCSGLTSPGASRVRKIGKRGANVRGGPRVRHSYKARQPSHRAAETKTSNRRRPTGLPTVRMANRSRRTGHLWPIVLVGRALWEITSPRQSGGFVCARG